MDKSNIEMPPGDTKHSKDVPYAQEIGSLLYFMITTRADIAFSVGKLSQQNQNPRTRDRVTVKRVLRIINGTFLIWLLVQYKDPNSKFD